MKRFITAIVLASAATGALAHDDVLGGVSEMYGSHLLDHGPGAPTGEVMKGEAELYGSILANPEFLKTDLNFTASPINHGDDWKQGELYKSIYVDIIESGS